MKYIYSLICFAFPFLMFSQIGIGTLTPDEELEIKGEVIFRKLETQNPSKYNRILSANDQGLLGYVNGSTDGYSFTNVYSVFMDKSVAIEKEGTADLNLTYSFDLKAKSSTIIIVNYNVPIYLLNKTNIDEVSTSFAGCKLVRTDMNGAQNEILGANRKFSFSSIYRGNNYRGMFVEGKWVEILINDSEQPKKVNYKVYGFVEGYANETVFFSFDKNNIDNKNGLGGMSLKVYTKAL